ncbi:MAG: hypothetical protein WC736_09695 [Gallionella sp.]|jgi:hypothetical protein
MKEKTEISELEINLQTAPDNFLVFAQGFDTEESATQFARLIGEYIRELSCYFDLSQLDGLTVAFDYRTALLNLDRGYESSYQLTPSDNHVVGIAMTPSVIRDGILKSHIVLNAALAIALKSPDHEHYNLALHTLAHECAHVEIDHRFNTVFPGVLLKKVYVDAHDYCRWKIILACWGEYAATWRSAKIGNDPTSYYEEAFVGILNQARPNANEFIKAYRTHCDIGRVMSEVYGIYGDLMKFAAYLLGNMEGQQISLDDLPITKKELEGHWFKPYFNKLGTLCKHISIEYGQWKDISNFEAIGDLADELVTCNGVILSHLEDGRLYVDIPCSSETMPT